MLATDSIQPSFRETVSQQHLHDCLVVAASPLMPSCFKGFPTGETPAKNVYYCQFDPRAVRGLPVTLLVEMSRGMGERVLEAPAFAEEGLKMTQVRECLENILRPPHMEQYVELFLQFNLSMDTLPQVTTRGMFRA